MLNSTKLFLFKAGALHCRCGHAIHTIQRIIPKMEALQAYFVFCHHIVTMRNLLEYYTKCNFIFRNAINFYFAARTSPVRYSNRKFVGMYLLLVRSSNWMSFINSIKCNSGLSNDEIRHHNVVQFVFKSKFLSCIENCNENDFHHKLIRNAIIIPNAPQLGKRRQENTG